LCGVAVEVREGGRWIRGRDSRRSWECQVEALWSVVVVCERDAAREGGARCRGL